MKARKGSFTKTGIVAFCAASVLAVSLAACAPAAEKKENASGDAAVESAEAGNKVVTASTMQEWGEAYPLQYNSYRQHYVHSDDGSSHGHWDLQWKVLAPVVREGTSLVQDENGNYAISGFEYDAESGQWVILEDEWGMPVTKTFKQGCYSCKSSMFDVAYEKNGAEIFVADMDEDFYETLNGQVWDCYICHEDVVGSAPDATLVFWTHLARENMDLFPNAEDRACGQCHNSFDYRSMVTDQEAMDSFAPYKYGLDVDGLFDAIVEDGCYSINQDTGHKFWYMDHPDIEFFQGSAMQEAGVTCVSCHMPETTDPESGETFTSHHASSSPLENPDALEYCLSCHKSQGIETQEDMVAMVRNLQAETAAVQDALQVKFDLAYALLTEANQSGKVDEAVLEECRDNYSRAEARFRTTVGSGRHGTKVAHNPEGVANYNAQADAMLDEIIAALS